MDWLTWAVLLLIAGLGSVVVVQLFGVGGTKTRKMWTWIGVGLIVAGGLPALGLTDYGFSQINNQIPLGGSTLAVGDDGTDPGTPSNLVNTGKTTLCAVEDTTVTLSGEDFYTSVGTGGTHRYKVGNNIASTVSNAGTFTASPGDVLNVLWMNGSETSSSYFSASKSYTVPCIGTFPVTEKLYRNGTVTIEVYNEEGNLIATTVENETVSAGDVVTLSAKLKGAYQRASPYGGVLIAEYGIPVLDDVIIDFGFPTKVATPSYYTLTNGSQTSKTYDVPPIFGTESLSGQITIDVDDTRDPTAVQVDVINLTYRAKDYFINQKTGGSYDGPGVEDEESTALSKPAVVYAVQLD